MEIRQLRHASVLAQTGSFVKAADKLNITQPALSRSIRSLEQELGVQLFERGRHGARLTREGKLLVERAEQVRLTLGGLRHDIELSRNGQLGDVGVGLGPMAAAIFLADLLAELITRYPRLGVRSQVNNSDQLRDTLLAERIDFIVHSAGQFVPDSRTVSSRLGDVPLSFFVRASHPLARKKRVTPEDLAAFPLMTGNAPQQPGARGAQLAGRLQPLKIGVSCDDFVTLGRVALRTDAVWHTSRAAIATECREGTLVELRYADRRFPYPATLVVTTLAGRNQSPAVALAIRIVRELFARLGV